MTFGALTRAGSQRREMGQAIAELVGDAVSKAYVLGLLLLLSLGWVNRSEQHITPETGIGYWLGIAGVAGLVLLLIYPFRKRIPGLRWIGSTPLWFRLHMALGLLSPTLILLHCNFNPGSANSSVALYAMLIVAGSGLVGRYLYGRVYRNLAGSRLVATDFFTKLSDPLDVDLSPKAMERLEDLIQEAVGPRATLLEAVRLRRSIASKSRRLLPRVRRSCERRAADRPGPAIPKWLARRRRRASLRKWLRDFDRAIWQASSLAVYERLFGLWHVLHLPLFILLSMAIVVHVIAVHLY